MDENRKIKVGYFIVSLAVGGAEGQLIELVKRIDKGKFSPIVYTMKGPDENIQAEQLEKHGIPLKPQYIMLKSDSGDGRRKVDILKFTGKILDFFREIKKEKIDIFHMYLPAAYLTGSFIAKAAGVPTIITSRRCLSNNDNTPFQITGEGKSLNKIINGILYSPLLRRFADRIVNSFTDRVVCNSKSVLDDTIVSEQISPAKVTCIYNGIFPPEKELTAEDREKYLSAWKRREDEVLIGVVSNLRKCKGHDYLLRAIPLIKEKFGKPFRVVLVGRDDDNRKNLDTIVEETGIKEDVVFAGSIPNARRLFPLFDISVLPSFTEGFSNTIIESLASGVPVIATNVGGNPEAVADGETGYIIPVRDSETLAEKVSLLLDNEELRRKMGEAGRRRVVECFSMEKMVKTTEDLYEEILKVKRK